jgi:hypothetical protein
MIGPIHAWLPSTLVTAPIALLGSSTLSDYLPALTTATTAAVAASEQMAMAAAHRSISLITHGA